MRMHIKTWQWVLLVVVIVVVVAAGIIGVATYRSARATQFQAVFLTNEQVYFGQIVRQSPSTIVLRSVYYLKVKQPLDEVAKDQAADLTLVKLGNELHGPTDEMRISRDQVIFTEVLRSDSRVVQAIRDYQAKQ